MRMAFTCPHKFGRSLSKAAPSLALEEGMPFDKIRVSGVGEFATA